MSFGGIKQDLNAWRINRGYSISTGSTGSASSTGSAGSAGSIGSAGSASSAGSLGGMMGDRVNGSSTSVGSAVLDNQEQEQWLLEQQQQDEYYRNQYDANPDINIPGNSYYSNESRSTSSSIGGNSTNYPSMTSIVVRPGDNLWSLVRRALGSSASDSDIARVVSETASSNNITNPNRIYPGQVIRIRTN